MGSYQVVQRDAVPYAAIAVTVPMERLASVGPMAGAVFGSLARQGVAPAGPPFWKYNVIDMAGQLELEVGVVTAGTASPDDQVGVGELPAGRYLETTFHGHPDGLQQATADLLAHAEAHGLSFDKTDSPRGDRWAARLEYYLTDPADQPDMTEWDTILSFKLAD